MKAVISSEFPFQSCYVTVGDTVIHYINEAIEETAETTFLYIHGNPTFSYLWRNIIPYTTPLGRSVALDLVGFGKSGKPAIDYTFQDHIYYVEGFIEKLNLKNIVLILHDWGGAIGFTYAMNHPENVKGIVFMETFCRPKEWSDLNFLARLVFKMFRNIKYGPIWNGKYNAFLRFILPMSINRKLTSIEKESYLAPFKTIESRKPIVQFPFELPFKNEGTLNEKIAANYYAWLKDSKIPKLLLYARPGVQITKKEVERYKSEFPNLKATYIGAGKHYIQEDQPHNIGAAIQRWFLRTDR